MRVQITKSKAWHNPWENNDVECLKDSIKRKKRYSTA